MSGRLIAIGDIHGCRVALDTLLDLIAPTSDDIIVTLGDYVDRGPDSRGVIDTLIDLKKQTGLVTLLGNHEEMMLEVLFNGASHHEWLKHGGVDTLDSYGFDGDLNILSVEHEQFFDSLGDYFETEDFFFTHAAYDPDTALEHQPSDMLRWYPLTSGVPARHINNKIAIVGHTANRDGEIFDVGHLICLDTYCYGGGWLTAMDVHSRQIWQVSNEGVVRR